MHAQPPISDYALIGDSAVLDAFVLLIPLVGALRTATCGWARTGKRRRGRAPRDAANSR
jgi:hypothetical protein